MPNLYLRLGAMLAILILTVPSIGWCVQDKGSARGASPVLKAGPGEVAIEGEYWAFVVGINDYRGAPPLRTAVADAKGIRDVLVERYGFKPDHIRMLIDGEATRSRIEGGFVKLAKEAGPSDSVLIYYAGHGQYSDDNQLAWWVPVDGNIDEPGTWILDAAIRNYVAAMRARHVYVIADSCFSGNLFAQTRAILPRLTDKYYAKLYDKRSRWGFTSGSTEPGADQGKDGHSVFAYHLIKFLRENDEPYLVPSRIADRWSLAWRGGEPPYAVTLETTGAVPRELFKAEGIESPRIAVPAPHGDFSGFVRLSVVDHAGEAVEANFEVVPAGQLPSTDESIRQAEVPAQLHALLQADFLIKEDAKRWSFQAYQSVAGLADSFEPARWLRDCLEEEAWCYRQ